MMENKLNITSIIFALVWLFIVVRSECNTSREVVCQEDEWRCSDKRQCIASNYLCDKNNDCIDGSDEQNCELFAAKTTKRITPKSTTTKTTKRTTPKLTTRIFTTSQKPITAPAGARKCGQPAIQPVLTNHRMVGGTPARPHSWPWYVFLYDNSTPNIPGCGGTIINETTVITAAHCLNFNTTLNKNLRIAAGSHNLLSSTDGPYQILSVIKTFMPDELNMPHDIAILILNKPLVFNDKVSAICLPKKQVTNEQNCYMPGYGDTYGQLPDTTLNQAKLPVVDWQFCKDNAFRDLTQFDFCAGYFNGKVNACPGDSGGPLTCLMNDSRWYLNGIVSRAVGCEVPDKPVIYTNVYQYIDWIVAKTGFKFE